jgi:hypothetical protein
MDESRLSGLKINGFSQAGVTCLGARGVSFGNNGQFVMEKLTLTPGEGASSGVGIRIQKDADGGDSGDLIVRNCRLIGPLSAGIAVSGPNPYRISISQCLFTKTQDGIRFEGSVPWKEILVLNNTFHEGRHGITFTNMPADGSMGLCFRRNLFTRMTGAEGVVSAGYDEAKLGAMLTADRPGWEMNYTDRAKPATPETGEINPLCDKRGEAGIAFASTDATNARFLAPAETAVQRNVPGAKDGERDWVGAVGP